MAGVECQISRWVSDEPSPGVVEAVLVDAEGQSWSFIDKVPIFSAASLTASSAFPLRGVIRCTVLDREGAGDAAIVSIDTERPDGVAAGPWGEPGPTVFHIYATQLVGG